MALSVIKSTQFTTPDGVEREVRFTLGTQRRVFEKYGEAPLAAIQKHGDGALAFVLWAAMFDREGNSPTGLSLIHFEESIAPEDRPELMGVLMEAITNGAAEKKMIADGVRTEMRKQAALMLGSTSGVSLTTASESAMLASSGGSPDVSSMPSPAAAETLSESPIIALELLQPQ